jgi:hypothetical protein
MPPVQSQPTNQKATDFRNSPEFSRYVRWEEQTYPLPRIHKHESVFEKKLAEYRKAGNRPISTPQAPTAHTSTPPVPTSSVSTTQAHSQPTISQEIDFRNSPEFSKYMRWEEQTYPSPYTHKRVHNTMPEKKNLNANDAGGEPLEKNKGAPMGVQEPNIQVPRELVAALPAVEHILEEAYA